MQHTRPSTETTRRFARFLALGLFVWWLLVLLAGADHPPPPGFLLVVALDVIAGVCVYFRVPVYLRWQQLRRPRRRVQVVIDGIVIGLLFAAVPVLFGSGEPSVIPRPVDYLIWFCVIAAVGVANTLLVYACTWLFLRFEANRTR